MDIWSFGVVIYTLLQGAFPFDAADMAGLRKKVLAGRWDRPLRASPEVVAVVQGMLTVNPAKRWTLDDVLQSPWLKASFPEYPDSYPIRGLPPEEPRDEVMRALASLGCPVERLHRLRAQLGSRERDHLTAAYELLADRTGRDGPTGMAQVPPRSTPH